MPSDSYYQHRGNPTQRRLIPSEPLNLQLPRVDDPAVTDEIFSATLRNLLLIAGVCNCGEWTMRALNMVTFPFNIIIFLITISVGIRLWDKVTSRPSLFLLAVPFSIHIVLDSLFLDAMLTATVAAYVGREYARHFVYLSLSKSISSQSTARLRQQWDVITLLSSMAVVPFMLPLVAPQLLPFAAMLGFSVIVCAFAICNPITLWGQLKEGWHSWFTFNHEEHSVKGIPDSPSGSLRHRTNLAIVLVCFASSTVNSALPISELIWGDLLLNSFAGCVLTTALGLVMFMLPLFLAGFLVFLVASPALMHFDPRGMSEQKPPSWDQIIEVVKNSDNPVEQDSLFFGRLSCDGSPLLIPRKVFDEHAHFLGDSGSGKTARGLLPLTEQLMSDGQSSLLVIDLKGDSQEILESLRHCSNKYGESGAPIPIRQFSVREDQATFAFNPFQLPCWQKLQLFQKTDVLCGALGLIYGTDYGRGYYGSANASIVLTTLNEFPEVGSFEELTDRIELVTSSPSKYGLSKKLSDAGNHVKMISQRLASFKALNVSKNSTPNESVCKNNMDPSQLFSNQEIFYFHLSTTLGPGSSPEIARLAMFMLLTSATLTDNRRQVYLVIDEFQRVAAHNVEAILQIARSMNVGVILANQSMNDLKRDNLVHVVEANCRYRQWYAISSPDEQLRLSKSSGETLDTLRSQSQTRQSDGFDVRHTQSESQSEFIAPRLSINDIKLASDDPRRSIALITRGAGYSQFGGMPIVVESDFHISEQEFLRRKNSPWPGVEEGSFVPANWNPKSPSWSKHKKHGPLVTEETIGGEGSLFDKFFADKQSGGTRE